MPMRILAVAIALSLAFPAHAQLKTEVVTVDVRPGVTMSYLGVAPAGPAKAAVILFAGGNGALKLSPSGTMGSDLGGNFLVRMRGLFARQGFYVAALDAASDKQGGMDGATRLSPQYAQDVAKVIAEVKKRSGAPIWLVGTSAGTLSVASAAARIGQADLRPSGVILTSTMTTLSAADKCGKTVYDASLAAIKAPVLVVSHRDDNCACTPGGAPFGAKLLAALAGTSAKEHKIVTGGNPPLSGPCDARAAHGYFGIEDSVVTVIADWIKSH
jgi:pimeloyl-ACP methyl ester carboxylesterase